MLTPIRRASRAGFTLTELLISMTLLALVGSAIVGVVISQQRFYRGTNELTETRAQLRQIASMLPTDLRGISAVGNDVYSMTDSSIEFRSTFGSSVVCKTITSGGGSIVLPPRKAAKGPRWTSWSQTPVIGDSIALYDESVNSGPLDDRWTMHQITGWTNVTGDVSSGCQSTNKFVLASDLTSTNPSFRLTLSPAFPATMKQGAAVRFYKRVRYNLYQASDGEWYLGYRDCLTSRTPQCSEVQPIGGPYQPYAAPGSGTSGVEFAYSDSLGAPTTIRQNLARITVVIRGESAEMVQLGGMQSSWTTFRDSLTLEVALRNRK
jgi:prepilin-type N-terminal cleavage/methylation domain-containing protein